MRRECLDHVLILSERHLRRVLTAYGGYFNRARPHQGIGQAVLQPAVSGVSSEAGSPNVIAFPVLGGLHHDYRRAA